MNRAAGPSPSVAEAAELYFKLTPENQRLTDRLIGLLLSDPALSAVFREMMESGEALPGAELSAFMDCWLEKKELPGWPDGCRKR